MMEGYKFYFAVESSICKEYFTGNNNCLQFSNSPRNLYPLKTDFWHIIDIDTYTNSHPD